MTGPRDIPPDFELDPDRLSLVEFDADPYSFTVFTVLAALDRGIDEAGSMNNTELKILTNIRVLLLELDPYLSANRGPIVSIVEDRS